MVKSSSLSFLSLGKKTIIFLIILILILFYLYLFFTFMLNFYNRKEGFSTCNKKYAKADDTDDDE